MTERKGTTTVASQDNLRRRLLRLEHPQHDPAADAKARQQRWLEAAAYRNAHPGWAEYDPDGTVREIEWQEWMGPWRDVQALIDDLEVATHDHWGSKRHLALCHQFDRMMARRPVDVDGAAPPDESALDTGKEPD